MIKKQILCLWLYLENQYSFVDINNQWPDEKQDIRQRLKHL